MKQRHIFIMILFGLILTDIKLHADQLKDFSDLLAATYQQSKIPGQSKTTIDTLVKRIVAQEATITSAAKSNVLRIGDRIKLRHKATNYFLHSQIPIIPPPTHPGQPTSAAQPNQPGQTPSTQPTLPVQGQQQSSTSPTQVPQTKPLLALCNAKIASWWIVKGPHVDKQRLSGAIWSPVNRDSIITLEQEGSGVMLHSEAGLTSLLGKQQGVSVAGEKGIGSVGDNWKIIALDRGDSITKNTAIKLSHIASNKILSSSDYRDRDGNQDVLCSDKSDDNAWWVVDQIIPSPATDLTILCAMYGDLTSAHGKQRTIVTEKLNALIYDNMLRFPIQPMPTQPGTAMATTFNIQDPNPNGIKNLIVFYQAFGYLYFHVNASEYDITSLPNPRDVKICPINTVQPVNKLTVLFAIYGDFNYTEVNKNAGAGTRVIPLWNVTNKVRSLIKNNQLNFNVTPKVQIFRDPNQNPLFQDPAPGYIKSLMVVYQYGRQIFMRIFAETASEKLIPSNTTQSTLIYNGDTPVNLPPNFLGEFSNITRVTVGSTRLGDLDVYGLTSNGQLLRYQSRDTTSDNPWKTFPLRVAKNKSLPSIKDVSMSSDGLLFVLDGQGKAYKYNPTKQLFVRIAAGPGNAALVLDRISVGSASANSLWAIESKTQTLYGYGYIDIKNKKTGWKRTIRKAVKISTGIDDSMAFIDPGGSSFLSDGGSIQPLSMKLDDIALARKDLIFGIKNGQLWQLTKNQWTPVNGKNGNPSSGFKSISCNAAGTLFILDQDGDLYHRGDAGFIVTKRIPAQKNKRASIQGKIKQPNQPTGTRSYAKQKSILFIDKNRQIKQRKLRSLRAPKKIVKKIVKKPAQKPVQAAVKK